MCHLTCIFDTVCFSFGSGFPTDCDSHPGDSCWAAGPDDPCSDGDSTGCAAEAHAAASGDHSSRPAADPWRPHPCPGASHLRQPEPAAQAPDEGPCRQVKDAHQTSVPLVGTQGQPQAGYLCVPPSHQRDTLYLLNPGTGSCGIFSTWSSNPQRTPFLCYVTD